MSIALAAGRRLTAARVAAFDYAWEVFEWDDENIMIVINDPSEIPSHFASEDEEAAFWDTHTLPPQMWQRERGPRPGSLAEKLSMQRFTPHAVFSKEVDAVYVYLDWGRTAKEDALDASRIDKYDADGRPIAVQFFNASRGIDLRGLPERERVHDLIRGLNLQVSA